MAAFINVKSDLPLYPNLSFLSIGGPSFPAQPAAVFALLPRHAADACSIAPYRSCLFLVPISCPNELPQTDTSPQASHQQSGNQDLRTAPAGLFSGPPI